MDKVSAKLFFEVWNSIAKENIEILRKNWRNNKNFTYLIRGHENSILSKIANKLNLKVYENDYYSLDAIFYIQQDKCPNINSNSYWFRNIKIAFEHENNFNSGLYQEISHLIVTNCDLRVLVTYPNDDDEALESLNHFSEIIKGNRKEKEFSDNEEILVIFGYESDLIWDGYIYKTEKWKKIKTLHTT